MEKWQTSPQFLQTLVDAELSPYLKNALNKNVSQYPLIVFAGNIYLSSPDAATMALFSLTERILFSIIALYIVFLFIY